MSSSTSIMGRSWVVMLIAGAAAAGCAADEPASPQPIARDRLIALADKVPAGMTRIELESNGQPKASAGWTQSAPGIWQQSGSAMRIIVGEQGHRSAIAQAKAEIAALQQRAADHRGGDAAQTGELQRKIDQLATFKASWSDNPDLPDDPPGNPPPTSCTTSILTGPSSPVSGFSGAAAIATVTCYQGCQTYTFQTQFQTDVGISALRGNTQTVCAGSPWTYGWVYPGSSGVGCAVGYQLTPPATSPSFAYFNCG